MNLNSNGTVTVKAPDTFTNTLKDVDVTVEVAKALQQGMRKQKYMEEDLKSEKYIIDQKNCTVTVKPSREDSYDRLSDDCGMEFASFDYFEDKLILHMDIHDALDKLEDDERKLIDLLFFEGKTEREVAEIFGISQPSINGRKDKILKKLKFFLKKAYQTEAVNG